MHRGALNGSFFYANANGAISCSKRGGFFRRHLQYLNRQVAVQLGGVWTRPSENMLVVPRDVRMDAEMLAFETHSVDVLLMPHLLEVSSADLVLQEAFRILKPEGRLILTGFNPKSLWGLSSWFDGEKLPLKSQCLALAELKRKIADIGFEMEYGQFMDYLPAVNSPSALKFWRFMEKAGDRWWPQCAAVYGMVLTKHLIGVHPLPELESAFDGNTVALSTARLAE